MAEIKLAPGTCWARIKGTNEYRILFDDAFDPEVFEKVDGPESTPEVRKQLPPEAPPKAMPELAEMSFQELKALSEYKQLPPNKNWRTKDDLLQAILEIRNPKSS